MYVGEVTNLCSLEIISQQKLKRNRMFFFSFFLCLHRAGHKLEGAIEQLGVDVAGKVALDSGLSTGGFTDCLLQYGASHVYGVDVGYGQVTCLPLLLFSYGIFLIASL